MSDARFNHIRIYGTGEPICNYYFKLDKIVINDFHDDLPSCMVCHERLVGHNDLESAKERWQQKYGEIQHNVLYLPPEDSPEYVTNRTAAIVSTAAFITGMVVMFIGLTLLVVK